MGNWTSSSRSKKRSPEATTRPKDPNVAFDLRHDHQRAWRVTDQLGDLGIVPLDALRDILTFCDLQQLGRISQTSKDLSALLDDQRIWKQRYVQYFGESDEHQIECWRCHMQQSIFPGERSIDLESNH